MRDKIIIWLDSLSGFQVLGVLLIAWLAAIYFGYIALMSQIRLNASRNDNKGPYSHFKGITYTRCDGCGSDTHKIAFQCCTECMVDLLKSLDQHFMIENRESAVETKEIKVAIEKPEDK
jgi:hypothetical protein